MIDNTKFSRFQKLTLLQSRYFDKYWDKLKDAFSIPYGLPELDCIRVEIHKDIQLGLYISAVTTINLLLELALKYFLEYDAHIKDPQFQNIKDINILLLNLKSKMDEFTNIDLDKTINLSATKGLITKEHKKKLHEFRIKYRNAFSHGDTNKMFGDKEVPMEHMQITDNGIKKSGEIVTKIADTPFLHGFALPSLAESIAPDYFLYVDKLIREMKDKVFRCNGDEE